MVKTSPLDFWLKGYFLLFLFKFLVVRPLYFIPYFYIEFFKKGLFLGKDILVDCRIAYPMGSLFREIVSVAWVCEKMNINLKVDRSTNMIWQYFENDIVNFTNKPNKGLDFSHNFLLHQRIVWYATFFISPEYGYKVLSKFSIKEELKEAANQWVKKNMCGDWIAIHYRGTDTDSFRKMDIASYIIYLKTILNNQCNIFACSDQIQFINQMHDAFPGRVFERDIQRSYDHRPLHRDPRYKGKQQIKDALIDVLILAKAKLIYTTGSHFIDIVQYFNPKTKIVSLDDRKFLRGVNYMPIPRRDLLKKLSLLS